MNDPQCGWCEGECTCDDTSQVLSDAGVKRALESPEYARALQALAAPPRSLFCGRKP